MAEEHNYLGLPEKPFLVRLLPPWHRNIEVKSARSSGGIDGKGLRAFVEKKVRLAAKALRKRLPEDQPRVPAQNWFEDSQTRLAVQDEVGRVLDMHLPVEGCDKVLFDVTRNKVFELTLDLAINHRKWAA